MSFDKYTRNLLAKTVASCRRRLIEDITDQLRGVFGLHPDGTVLPLDRLTYLSPDQTSAARHLRELLDHYIIGAAGKEADRRKAAYERIVLEISFTILNRLAALRLCEERGLVIECVRKGTTSAGFQMFERISGGALGGRYITYRVFLECLFDELALDLGVLFDRMMPQSAVFPSERCMEDVLAELNKPELKNLWIEDETIGWVYQYFNPKEERDAMRKASRSPRNTRELAVRNQFFTPRYVVEFLTDNTLGRIWYEMHKGQTALKEECRYLGRRPNETFLAPGEQVCVNQEDEANLSQEELLRKPVQIEDRPKKDPRDLRVLDPACGSGHFLLYAFDLLERIYEEGWADPESPKSKITGRILREDFETLDDLHRAVPKLIIEHNLNGIDIDTRAVQIAALALWLRAQKTWKNLGIRAAERPRVDRSNIVTAEPMPGEEDMRLDFTAGLKPRVLGQLVYSVFEKMKLAGEAGSLLKIEEEIKNAVADARRQWLEGPKPEQQFLFPGMADKRQKQQQLRFEVKGFTDERFWEQAEDRILEALEVYAERAENGLSIRRRLFSEDAARGFAFIKLCRNRYDAILMNPPFGASSRESKDYIEDRYPKTKGDVLANFIERALHLTDEQGRVGAISSRTPFFLGSFETFRTEILGKIGRIRLLADLGEGVLEAMVETAIYVMTKNRPGEPESLFFRLLIDADKGEFLKQLTEECLDGCISDRTFINNPGHFGALKGKPYAYWVSRSTIETVSQHPCIEGTKGTIRVGMQTGDDFRFLRCLWEIDPRLVSPSPTQTASKETPRQKCIRELTSDRVWVPFSKTETASPWFSPITLVAKWFANGDELRHFTNDAGKLRSALRSEQEYFKPGFSYMLRSTRLVPYLVPSGVIPTAGRAQIFPEQGEEYAVLGICASNVGSAIARFSGEKFAWPKFQASMVQELPACDFPEEMLALIKKHVDAEVNKRRSVVQRYEPFQEFTLPAWIQTAAVGETAWDLYSLFGRGIENKIAEAFGLNSKQLGELERDIREAVSIRGRMEDSESEDVGEDSSGDEQELNIELISETPEEKAIGLFGYAVGVVLGRWDVRIASHRSLAPKLPDPFNPLPVCPPGMLVGPDCMPAEPGRIVSEEWLRARPDANTLPTEGSVKNPIIRDSDYPLRISWDGILVDDPGFNGNQLHRDDIVRRVREVFDLLWKDKAHEIEQEACDILGVSDLRDYFRRPAGFFQDNLKRYSKSRRKAPIYWPLSTVSGSYTIWLYYHRLSDQILYGAVNKYVEPKIAEIERGIGLIENDLKTASGRDATRLTDRLSETRTYLGELRELREEMLRIAALPYKPNLNDGVIINAAPFHNLFRFRPWAKDTEDCWKKLRKGDYDWAHLAYTIRPDQVREACRTDRSIAIAHGLENICEVEAPDVKKKGSRGRRMQGAS
ncbi:MAG: BREX-1 system adenine-specific DNA-methyltransferase PglX [Desulfobacteraceae bacterium]|nr:MAG: BREX-1 system adenine-specific DNA-methyltransferase PglX [Desulfobacteraceae bacterium]